MPGLMPGIHVFHSCLKDVDGRDKPGHDGGDAKGSFLMSMMMRRVLVMQP
jgi:hypothetical protein